MIINNKKSGAKWMVKIETTDRNKNAIKAMPKNKKCLYPVFNNKVLQTVLK